MRHAVRVTRPTLVAAAAAALLVTGCSGDGESDDELAGAETQAPESTDAAEEEDAAGAEPPDDGIERPEIELPEDMVNVFEDTETGDETRDAIIADVVRGIEAVDLAFAEQDPNIDAVGFYHIGDGLVSSKEFIRDSTDHGLSWGGSVTYYDFAVDNEGRRSEEPIVTYCTDITELQNKDVETGELLPKQEDGQNVFAEQVVVHESEQGVWQVAAVLPMDEELDVQCQR